jgi:transitional endoplasmic reticulum ATPase
MSIFGDRRKAQGALRGRAFAAPNTLFPSCALTITPARMPPGWAKLFAAVVNTEERVVVIPSNLGELSQFGTESSVTWDGLAYQIWGFRRVRIVEVEKSGNEATRATYLPLTDHGGDGFSVRMLEPIIVTFMQWARTQPGAEFGLTSNMEPAALTNTMCQAMFFRRPDMARLLGVDILEERLQQVVTELARLGFVVPHEPEPRPAPPSVLGVPSRTTSRQPLGDLKLPSFNDVGGMESLKAQLRDAVGLVLADPQGAARLRIRLGGILLYGPPGNGKTFIARATAGEFKLNFLAVSGSDIHQPLIGASEAAVRQAFKDAAARTPCLLFIDELDSLAPREGEGSNEGLRRGVRQALLECLDGVARTPGLVLMAATNVLDQLDPAVIREGRFDKHISVTPPDAAARRAIFEVQLRGRAEFSTIGFNELVVKTEGVAAATIEAIVNSAAVQALKRRHETGAQPEISQADLLHAIEERLRPGTRPVKSWDEVILEDGAKREIQLLQRVIEDPMGAKTRGVKLPKGAILYGPPGTGKTTIAKVLAAQTKCSFEAVSAADLKEKWVGSSERNVKELFDRARQRRPAIIFIDELDSVGSTRLDSEGYGADAHNSLLSQLLNEIDGFESSERLFVIGATNLFDSLDGALSSRLSEHIEVARPGLESRKRLLELFTRDMPLADALDFDSLAQHTDGLSGRDIETVCQRAARSAFGRDAESVDSSDFAAALEVVRTSGKQAGEAPIGLRDFR